MPGKVTDLWIDGKYWEVESYEGKFRIGKLSRMIKKGQEQSPYVAIKLNHWVETDRVKRQLKKLLETKDFETKLRLKRIIFVSNNGNVIFDKMINPDG